MGKKFHIYDNGMDADGRRVGGISKSWPQVQGFTNKVSGEMHEGFNTLQEAKDALLNNGNHWSQADVEAAADAMGIPQAAGGGPLPPAPAGGAAAAAGPHMMVDELANAHAEIALLKKTNKSLRLELAKYKEKEMDELAAKMKTLNKNIESSDTEKEEDDDEPRPASMVKKEKAKKPGKQ